MSSEVSTNGTKSQLTAVAVSMQFHAAKTEFAANSTIANLCFADGKYSIVSGSWRVPPPNDSGLYAAIDGTNLCTSNSISKQAIIIPTLRVRWLMAPEREMRNAAPMKMQNSFAHRTEHRLCCIFISSLLTPARGVSSCNYVRCSDATMRRWGWVIIIAFLNWF